MITIKETTVADIKNLQSLWADGDVMPQHVIALGESPTKYIYFEPGKE